MTRNTFSSHITANPRPRTSPRDSLAHTAPDTDLLLESTGAAVGNGLSTTTNRVDLTEELGEPDSVLEDKTDSTRHNEAFELQADRLRHKLCLARVKDDSERTRLLTIYDFAQASAEELIAFTVANPTSLQNAPETVVLEYERLLQQAESAKHALRDQVRTARATEARLRKIEARISSLGVWFVHIPDFSP